MSPSGPEQTSEKERIANVEALAGRLDDEALARLLDAARDDSWRVRERAVRYLSAFPSTRLIGVVRDTISGAREPSVRNAAMDALVRLGETSLPAIFPLLRDENWELRLHGTVMLGNIRSPKAVEELARLLVDSEENVVHAAAESLGSIGDPKAIGFLVEVLKTQEFWSQYPTVVALGRIAHHSATEDLLAFLGDEMLAPAVVDALGAIADPRALQPLLNLLGQIVADPIVPVEQVLKALVRIIDSAGKEVRPNEDQRAGIRAAVAEALGREEAEHRVAALIVAAWAADAALVPLIVPRLANDAEQEAAYHALRAVGREAGPALAEMLDAPLPSVRRMAIRLIAEVGFELAPALRHIIDPDETVRMEVALAVGLSGNSALTEYLFEMLLDESEDVRRVALEVLATFRTEQSVREQLYRRLEYYPDDHLPIIIETLGRVDIVDALPRLRALVGAGHGPQVRAAVVRSVAAAGEEAAKEILLSAAMDSASEVRVEAIRGLGLFKGREVFDTLASALTDPDAHCSYAAVVGLGNIADEAAIPLLEKIASDAKQELGVRVAAVTSLGKLQAQGSAGALADLLSMRDDDVRREVTKALSNLQGPEAFHALVRASMDSFWAVRGSAVMALAQRGVAGLEFVVRALEDPEPLVRKAAVRGLAHAGPTLALRLIPLLADDALEDVVAKTLEGFGEHIVAHIEDAIEQPDPTLRLRLARVLGHIHGDRAQRVLRRLASDPVPEVAALAGKALASK